VQSAQPSERNGIASPWRSPFRSGGASWLLGVRSCLLQLFGARLGLQDQRAQVKRGCRSALQRGLPRDEWLVAWHLLDGEARQVPPLVGPSSLRQPLGSHDLQSGVEADR
jgi:hypothetical protein